jgi:hypothetical protein
MLHESPHKQVPYELGHLSLFHDCHRLFLVFDIQFKKNRSTVVCQGASIDNTLVWMAALVGPSLGINIYSFLLRESYSFIWSFVVGLVVTVVFFVPVGVC